MESLTHSRLIIEVVRHFSEMILDNLEVGILLQTSMISRFKFYEVLAMAKDRVFSVR